MEDFKWNGVMFKAVLFKGIPSCLGCFFHHEAIDCSKADDIPLCVNEEGSHKFVLTSQNALQQEQEASS